MTSTHWHKQGAIPGGTVLALAAIDQICLAGTLAGLHRSEDGGRTWLHLRYGDAIHALAMASSEAAFAMFSCAPGIDFDRFRSDLDALASQETEPRG